MSEPIIDSSAPTVLAGGLDHPEAVCWAPRSGTVLAGGEAGQLYEIGLEDGIVHERGNLPGGNLLGIALDGAGTAHVCDTSSGHVQRLAGDGWEAHGPKMTYPNYPAFDAEGALWVTDSGSWGQRAGSVLRVDPDGRGERHRSGPFAFANGIAVAARVAYLVESETASIWRLDLDDGSAEVIVELPRTVPDGIALDSEGGIWVSCFQPNRIYRLDACGELAVVLDDWSGEDFLSPTNVAFAGDGLRTLVLASLCGRTLKRVDVWVAGRELEYPSLDRERS
ncbi:MAG: SMP-30/gluconolactonase/LRE family protein [Solirubrobacterales bacterium]